MQRTLWWFGRILQKILKSSNPEDLLGSWGVDEQLKGWRFAITCKLLGRGALRVTPARSLWPHPAPSPPDAKALPSATPIRPTSTREGKKGAMNSDAPVSRPSVLPTAQRDGNGSQAELISRLLGLRELGSCPLGRGYRSSQSQGRATIGALRGPRGDQRPTLIIWRALWGLGRETPSHVCRRGKGAFVRLGTAVKAAGQTWGLTTLLFSFWLVVGAVTCARRGDTRTRASRRTKINTPPRLYRRRRWDRYRHFG